MSKVLSAVACNLDTHILQAILPLFAAEKVEAIEWSFDALFRVRNIPDWFVELLHQFAQADRLIGHGIFFSLFSGQWSPEQERWLAHLKKVSDNFGFDHITEHFGFMTGENFHTGAPISIPFNKSTLQIGQDRLKRIYHACSCPVGLENLAFAYSLDEVKQHGEFLDQLLQPINGFIILDLHNLYCQLHNFAQQYEDLIRLYPLHRVREIHISGGSWEDSTVLFGQKIRRDTHDDRVPEVVFQLLEKTIDRCPNLKYVVLEQLGTALDTPQNQSNFQADFLRLHQILQNHNQQHPQRKQADFLPEQKLDLSIPAEDLVLHQQQIELSQILETAKHYQEAQTRLSQSSLANSDWHTERWAPQMLETVIHIAQKWKKGWN